MIRNFIQFHRRAFTTRDVERATGIKRRTVTNVLRDFRLKGVIKVIGTEKKQLIYIKVRQARGAKNILADKIEKYVQNVGKPFTNKDVCAHTGCKIYKAR